MVVVVVVVVVLVVVLVVENHPIHDRVFTSSSFESKRVHFAFDSTQPR